MSNWSFAMVPANLGSLGLSALELALYTILCTHADRHTGECYPTVSTLAKEAGMSPRSVSNVLRSLENRGLITRQARVAPEGDNLSNLYTVLWFKEGVQEVQEGVQEMQAPPAGDAGRGVQDVHPGGAGRADKQESFNKNHGNNNQPNYPDRPVEEQRCREWIIRQLEKRRIPTGYAEGILTRALLKAHTSLSGYLETVGLPEFLDEYEDSENDPLMRAELDRLYGYDTPVEAETAITPPISAKNLHELHWAFEQRRAVELAQVSRAG